MDTDPTNSDRIAALETELQTAKKEAQKYTQELKNLRQQYADDLFEERKNNKRLHEERQRLQRDYAQLRVQKGGFGIKILVLSGFGGFVTALVLCLIYLFFLKPKDQHTAQFEHFRDQHQFGYERAISLGDFESVERDLQTQRDLPENKIIRPEIEFTRKIVSAAKRRCE